MDRDVWPPYAQAVLARERGQFVGVPRGEVLVTQSWAGDAPNDAAPRAHLAAAVQRANAARQVHDRAVASAELRCEPVPRMLRGTLTRGDRLDVAMGDGDLPGYAVATRSQLHRPARAGRLFFTGGLAHDAVDASTPPSSMMQSSTRHLIALTRQGGPRLCFPQTRTLTRS